MIGMLRAKIHTTRTASMMTQILADDDSSSHLSDSDAIKLRQIAQDTLNSINLNKDEINSKYNENNNHNNESDNEKKKRLSPKPRENSSKNRNKNKNGKNSKDSDSDKNSSGDGNGGLSWLCCC